MVRRYTYRAYPDKGQEKALARTCGATRFIHNQAVEAADQFYKEHGTYPGLVDLQKTVVTNGKDRFPWLREVSGVPLIQAVRDVDAGYHAFFASLKPGYEGPRVGKPTFHSRKSHRGSARYTRAAFSGGTIPVRTAPGSRWGKVRLPKGVGWLRFRNSRPLPSDPSSVTVLQRPDGTWEVSFVVGADNPKGKHPRIRKNRKGRTTKAGVPSLTNPAPPLTPEGRAAGIDMGLNHLAAIVYSDGTREKIDNPRPLRQALRRLKKKDRALARKQKGSTNREKARLARAKAESKVARTRLDHHHKLANRLADENQVIAVEALQITTMTRKGKKGNRKSKTGLNRSIQDAGWGTLTRLLAEKTQARGGTLIKVDPAGTSRTCSICGTNSGAKGLSVRVWVCPTCGSTLDRDFNAAVNIMLAAGLAESLNACGDHVRRHLAGAAVDDEAGTHRTDQNQVLAA